MHHEAYKKKVRRQVQGKSGHNTTALPRTKMSSILESGILYVSMKYAICGHLCACGCGEKVITPLSPKQWKIAYNGEDVTLYPSIGNYAFACQSHYFLTNGNIIWVGERDVEKGKRKKKGLLTKLFNSKKDKKNGNKTRSKKDCKIHR